MWAPRISSATAASAVKGGAITTWQDRSFDVPARTAPANARASEVVLCIFQLPAMTGILISISHRGDAGPENNLKARKGRQRFFCPFGAYHLADQRSWGSRPRLSAFAPPGLSNSSRVLRICDVWSFLVGKGRYTREGPAGQEF